MDRKLIRQRLCCTQSQLRQPLELLFILKSSPSDSFLCCYYYGKFCTQKSTLTSMYQEPSPPPHLSHPWPRHCLHIPIFRPHRALLWTKSQASSHSTHKYVNVSLKKSRTLFPQHDTHTIRPSHLTEETNCCGDPLGRLTAATCTACLPFPTRMDLICFLPRPRPSGRTGCLAAPRTHRPPRALVSPLPLPDALLPEGHRVPSLAHCHLLSETCFDHSLQTCRPHPYIHPPSYFLSISLW